jgi:hypothetical protein
MSFRTEIVQPNAFLRQADKAGRWFRGGVALFAKKFGHDENEDGAAQSTARQ